MFRRIIKTALSFCAFIILMCATGWVYLLSDYGNPRNPDSQMREIIVNPGDGVWEIARKISSEGLVKYPISVVLGSWMDGKSASFKDGTFRVDTSLSPREIVELLTGENAGLEQIQVTFPEGWTAEKMAERLTGKGLPGERFLDIARNPPPSIVAKYRFLSDIPPGASLEGYLFPDTYRFYSDATAQDVIGKMLDNFDRKFRAGYYEEAKKRSRSVRDLVIMASIVEGEVRSEQERKIVSGIFWKRLDEGMLLQSDATLEYVLKTNAVQHSLEETRNDSLYNTYVHKGLPPGPVSNPSLVSLDASVNSQSSDYYFFLSDPTTGETHFAVSFDEHIANKRKVGL